MENSLLPYCLPQHTHTHAQAHTSTHTSVAWFMSLFFYPLVQKTVLHLPLSFTCVTLQCTLTFYPLLSYAYLRSSNGFFSKLPMVTHAGGFFYITSDSPDNVCLCHVCPPRTEVWRPLQNIWIQWFGGRSQVGVWQRWVSLLLYILSAGSAVTDNAFCWAFADERNIEDYWESDTLVKD